MVSRRVRAAFLGVTATVLALPALASGAVTIGETFAPTTLCQGTAASTWIQSSAPQGRYAAPSAGVVTSWSHFGDLAPPLPTTVGLRVLRPAGASAFALVGASAQARVSPGVLNTFPARIPVQDGDLLGMFVSAIYHCAAPTATSTGYGIRWVAGDVPAGPTTFTDSAPDFKLDLAARIEPDADGDGFGDETQDLCPTNASTQDPCPDTDPPETEITKRPADKSTKPRAAFKFSSDDPGATFECKLKGTGLKKQVKQFHDCDSPRRYKHLDQGEFKFKVRAIDAAGNIDPTPAKDKFKVAD